MPIAVIIFFKSYNNKFFPLTSLFLLTMSTLKENCSWPIFATLNCDYQAQKNIFNKGTDFHLMCLWGATFVDKFKFKPAIWSTDMKKFKKQLFKKYIVESQKLNLHVFNFRHIFAMKIAAVRRGRSSTRKSAPWSQSFSLWPPMTTTARTSFWPSASSAPQGWSNSSHSSMVVRLPIRRACSVSPTANTSPISTPFSTWWPILSRSPRTTCTPAAESPSTSPGETKILIC